MSDSDRRTRWRDPTPEEAVAETRPRAGGNAHVLAKVAAVTTGAAGDDARAVGERYGRPSGGSQDVYRAARTGRADWEDGLERYLRRNPVTSLLATAGVSLLLGFALGRRTAIPPARGPWWRP